MGAHQVTPLDIAQEAAAELKAGNTETTGLAKGVLRVASFGVHTPFCERVLIAMGDWHTFPQTEDQLEEEQWGFFTDSEGCWCDESDCICDRVAVDIARSCIAEADRRNGK